MTKRLFYFVTLSTFISATMSGIVGMLEPTHLRMIGVEQLHNGPFTDFFIVSVILTGLGLMNATVLMMMRLSMRYVAQASIVVGAFQVSMVIIQVYILASINILDVMYLLLGMCQMLYGIKLLHAQRLVAWWTEAID